MEEICESAIAFRGFLSDLDFIAEYGDSIHGSARAENDIFLNEMGDLQNCVVSRHLPNYICAECTRAPDDSLSLRVCNALFVTGHSLIT